MIQGWGNRQANWQMSLALQHELTDGVGLTVGYYRTSFGNFVVRDNLTVAPGDYDEYCVTAPQDSRLPEGGGQELCGLYDLNPAKFGLPPDTVATQSSHFSGDAVEKFNGVDVTVTGRFQNGAFLSGGVGTGSHAIYNCQTIDSPQNARPGFCENRPPWSAGTQVKMNGNYPLPWGGLELAAVYQNLPGGEQQATAVFTNAQIEPSLGRNLSGCPTAVGPCTAQRTLAIVERQSLFERRTNQLDLRFTKVIEIGRTRIRGMFDIYNLTNDNNVLSSNSRFGGAWLTPFRFHGARLLKFSAEIEY